ncbi:MAG: hypothetical protein ACI4TF_10240 [Oliverpabstia sp.]
MQKKYESDLTNREKRKLEWEKIKELKGKNRWEYLWMYYKPVLGIIASVILILGTGGTMIQNGRQKTVLSIVVVDADRENIEAFDSIEQELMRVLGSGKRGEQVVIDTAATSNQDDESIMNVTIKLSTAGENDVVICNTKIYERFNSQGIFADWKEILGDEFEEFRPYIEGNALNLTKSYIWNAGGYVQYKPVYLCVLERSENQEKASELAKYFIGDSAARN